ncbi:DUF1128 domain-containing protein [Numidum massiliense]|uniref:DUF1128 domain-containing protein n=1 Tax=Numidum massiliense TaxID=1522315 RepID=UPI0006D5B6A1|nr:DUF1128 family protein [Numidum massiliense]
MNLQEATSENMAFMITDLKKRLKTVNDSLINPDDFRLEDYAELRDIYELVAKRESLSMMEIEGILTELRELRGRK